MDEKEKFENLVNEISEELKKLSKINLVVDNTNKVLEKTSSIRENIETSFNQIVKIQHDLYNQLDDKVKVMETIVEKFKNLLDSFTDNIEKNLRLNNDELIKKFQEKTLVTLKKFYIAIIILFLINLILILIKI
mgnify:CR=1 FL=1